MAAGAPCGSGGDVLYLSALTLAPIVCVWIFLGMRGDGLLKRLVWAIYGGATTCLGFVAFLLLAQAQTGRWNAYFLVHLHSLQFPFAILLPMLRGPFAGVTYVQGIWDTEAILATVLVLGLLIGLVMRTSRKLATWQDWLVFALLVLCWLGPLSQANLSYWRSDTLLLPAVLLLPKMPDTVAVILTGAAVAVFGFLAVFFLTGRCVMGLPGR